MTAALIIGAWSILCLILLLANHCFKLSRKAEGERLPDEHASHIGIGGAGAEIIHIGGEH